MGTHTMIAPSRPDNEEERLEALRSLGLLDTPPEDRFDQIVRLATVMFDVPIAYISLVDEKRQFLKSEIGLGFCESSRDTSFCGHTILQSQPLIIEDTLRDTRFADNPMVVGPPHARFYVGHPLQAKTGLNVATLCLMDRKARSLSTSERGSLGVLARLAERELRLGDLLVAQEQLLQTKDALLAAREEISQQMEEALDYVRSLLPLEITGPPLSASYAFEPSSALGGDCLGFHWIDEEHFAVYLLDVCGHGVGAALLSVSAMEVIRKESLPHVDFRDPGEVVAAMNRTFPMEKNNGLFFTLWYGVLHRSSRALHFCSAGHPPAVISRAGNTKLLTTQPKPPIGCWAESVFVTERTEIPEGSSLYVFSDGLFETPDEQGGMGGFGNFAAEFAEEPSPEEMVAQIRKRLPDEGFPDDVSVIRVRFGEV